RCGRQSAHSQILSADSRRRATLLFPAHRTLGSFTSKNRVRSPLFRFPFNRKVRVVSKARNDVAIREEQHDGEKRFVFLTYGLRKDPAVSRRRHGVCRV